MKEWNKPQLLSLGLESTFEDGVEDISDNNTHYCHAEGIWHSTSDCKPGISDHYKNNDCKGSDVCGWDQKGNSKCCCNPRSIEVPKS